MDLNKVIVKAVREAIRSKHRFVFKHMGSKAFEPQLREQDVHVVLQIHKQDAGSQALRYLASGAAGASKLGLMVEVRTPADRIKLVEEATSRLGIFGGSNARLMANNGARCGSAAGRKIARWLHGQSIVDPSILSCATGSWLIALIGFVPVAGWGAGPLALVLGLVALRSLQSPQVLADPNSKGAVARGRTQAIAGVVIGVAALIWQVSLLPG